MHPYAKIFVAIDFSTGSDEALRQAHERASSTGAKLAVCHIIPNELRSNLLFPHLSRAAALEVPAETQRASDAVANHIEKITGLSRDDVTILVDHGTPYAEILKAAESWKADLIVIGSHGMTSSAGVLLGSVTHKIIRSAHAAVLVVRKTGPGAIVAGTDFSDPALPAIEAAVAESRRTNRALTVVHSIDLVFPAATHAGLGFGAPIPPLTDADYAALKQAAHDRLRQALKKFGASGETLVVMGPAGPALVATAKNLNAGLLVVGTIGLTGLSRMLLGSVADAAASEANCSVLITRLH